MSVSLAIPPEAGMDARDFTQAVYNVTSTGLLQVCTELLMPKPEPEASMGHEAGHQAPGKRAESLLV